MYESGSFLFSRHHATLASHTRGPGGGSGGPLDSPKGLIVEPHPVMGRLSAREGSDLGVVFFGKTGVAKRQLTTLP